MNFVVKDFVTCTSDQYLYFNTFNPIQDEGGGDGWRAKSPPYQFFPCNIYKRRS